jgi:hypothetical protein
MGLVDDVAARFDLDPEKAAVGLGSLLFAVRLGLDARSWEQVRGAVPEAGTLLGRASTTAGRTAEMVSLTAPGAVRKTLDAAGRAFAALDRALG